MTDNNKPRGRCVLCGRDIQLKTDGTVRHHLGETSDHWPYTRLYQCDGSGRMPKTGEDQ
jgi:hypothetical protein